MKRIVLMLAALGVALTTLLSAQGGDPNYGKPKRLNKMIELLAAGQPVYDMGVTGGGYEEGKKLAQTTNDMILYEMEHGPFNPHRLREFMQGLIDGGPTKSRPPNADGAGHAAIPGSGRSVGSCQYLGDRADPDHRRPRPHDVSRAQRRGGQGVRPGLPLSV